METPQPVRSSSKYAQVFDALLPVFATLAALAVGAVMLILLAANPLTGYAALLEGAFGSANALADTVVTATPLLLVGQGICIAFRGGVINIGGGRPDDPGHAHCDCIRSDFS
jgi:simple sugar transport system permease protein